MNHAAIHRYIGIITVLVFFITGVYMFFNFPGLYGDNQVIRFLYRANHVYLLFGGLLNVAFGLYVHFSDKKWQRYFQNAGSVMIQLGPIILLAAFYYEPSLASPERPWTTLGVTLLLAGTAFHVSSGWFSQK